MGITEAKNIYCLGIGGIGVSGLARLFLALGKKIAGSDLKKSEITLNLEKLGIKITIGPSPESLEGFDLLVYSSAIPKQDLDKLDIPKLSHGEAIGKLMLQKYGIGITGTNGKSTTAAMLGLILEKAGLDPTVLIGSLLSPKNETEKFKANARFGSGRHFVAESDEYGRKMLKNKPQMIILTNIAEDHPDCYKDLADIKAAFLEYITLLPKEGILIYNADDHNTVEICKHAACHKFTFGIRHYADLQALNMKYEAGDMKQAFDLHYDDEMIGIFELQVPGLFNILNALGAALAAIKLGVKTEVIRKTLSEYAGLWRRFEVAGKIEGKPVISDYAHHPAAIFATLKAAEQFYPNQKVLVVFQPHQRSRTKELFGQFVDQLANAQEVIIPEIFDVAGRERGEDISSRQLVEELLLLGVKASFCADLDETEKLVREKLKNFDVILLMGAGDIDKLARKIVK